MNADNPSKCDNQFDRAFTTVVGFEASHALAGKLLKESAYYEVTPLPDDVYEFAVKVDRKDLLPVAESPSVEVSVEDGNNVGQEFVLTPESFNLVMYQIMAVISYVPQTIEALHQHCSLAYNNLTVEDVKGVLDGMIRIGAVDVDPQGLYFDCLSYTAGYITRGTRPAE